MKKYILFTIVLFTLCFNSINAQVGISLVQNDTYSFTDAQLHIKATDKGVLIPQINITNVGAAAPVSNPANSLLIYNTNTTDKGFYYWSTTDSKWIKLLDIEMVKTKMETIISYSIKSNATKTMDFSSTYLDNRNPVLGEDINSYPKWNLIPGVTKTISTTNSDNIVNVTLSGVGHANNSDGISWDFIVGIFLDDKLIGMRPYVGGSVSGSGTYYKFEAFSSFSITSNTNHTIKVAVLHRNLAYGSGSTSDGDPATLRVAYGGKNALRDNLNNFMAQTNMKIDLIEYPN